MPARIAISGQLHLSRTIDQLFSRTPLLYSTPTFALMSTPSAVEGPRPLFRLISRAPIPASHSSSPADQFSSFSAHLYQRTDFLPLCFHSLTNPSARNSFVFTSMRNPGVSPCASFPPQKIAHHKITSYAVSESWGLFISFAAFFRARALCFQSFADSFAKTPGWG